LIDSEAWRRHSHSQCSTRCGRAPSLRDPADDVPGLG